MFINRVPFESMLKNCDPLSLSSLLYIYITAVQLSEPGSLALIYIYIFHIEYLLFMPLISFTYIFPYPVSNPKSLTAFSYNVSLNTEWLLSHL